MKPYYEHAGITIYHGDCRDILPGMDAGSADAMITDPPFGINWSRASWPDSRSGHAELMSWLVAQATKIILNGWCFVFQSMLNVARFHEWFPEGWRLFAACKNFAQIRPTVIWHSWDPVVFWANGVAFRNTDTTKTINRDYFVGNVAGVIGEKAEHPCPKPLDTMKYIVSIACPIHKIVLDPFCGSGTTFGGRQKYAATSYRHRNRRTLLRDCR